MVALAKVLRCPFNFLILKETSISFFCTPLLTQSCLGVWCTPCPHPSLPMSLQFVIRIYHTVSLSWLSSIYTSRLSLYFLKIVLLAQCHSLTVMPIIILDHFSIHVGDPTPLHSLVNLLWHQVHIK
jgi:hypothetical protein